MKARVDRTRRGPRVPGVLLGAALFIATVLGGAAAHAATPGARDVETEIKAAYLYHFSNYIRWPDEAFASPDAPLVLAVAGPASVADTIGAVLAGRVAGSRPLAIRRLDAGDSLEGVHLLFISESFERTPRLVDAAHGRPVLVVTEGGDSLRAGSAVHFVVENDRVRFDIAPDEIRQQGLDVSAQLLTVARLIREPEN